MNHRAEYLLQVLEKIGSPLLASVIEANKSGDPQIALEAQKIAELLAKSVQTGIDMGYALDLGPTGEVTDSIRLALTGVAAPLVAGIYKNSGRAPNDTEVKKIGAAMQAVLTFAENFPADSDHTDRLKNAGGDAAPDKAQALVQHLHAFVPVVNAVGAFSFGQQEQKLIVEAASRITAQAARLRESSGADKSAEAGIVRALALIYASSHQAETRRILSLSAQERQGLNLSLDPVWKNFETRVAMLEALSGGVAGAGASSGGGVEPQPAAPQSLSEGPPPQTAPPMQPLQAAPPQQPAGASPLGMFAKKPAGDAPPAQPQQTAPAAPPPQQPPAQAPQQGGSPMSFFKTPPKQAEG